MVLGQLGRAAGIGALIAAAAVLAATASAHEGASPAPCRSTTAAPAEPCPPVVRVHVRQSAMDPSAASETPVTATCTNGTVITGGGVLQDRDNGSLPTNGLRIHGDVPSSRSGKPAANGSHNPTAWTGVGGFGGTGETGDEVKAFALCVPGGQIGRTLIVSKTVKGPKAAATIRKVTVTCPSGSSLIGGGGSTHPPSDPSLKTIGSYPSTAGGKPFAAGESDPRSWTAVGAAGGMRFGTGQPTTTVFAICALKTAIATKVARANVIDHPAGPGNLNPGSDPFVVLTASCKTGTTLLGGGALTNGAGPGPDGAVPQQGVHVRGSYPSDPKGLPIGDGASAPSSWTAIVQAGGQATPGTDSYVFALCAV